VKGTVPDIVVVPLIIPLAESVKPAGREPEASAQLYGGVPPDALSVSRYAVPTLPPGRGEDVVMTRGESEPFVRLSRCPVESVTSVLTPRIYAQNFVNGLLRFFHIIFAELFVNGVELLIRNLPRRRPGVTGMAVPFPDPGGVFAATLSSLPLMDKSELVGRCDEVNCDDPLLMVKLSVPDDIAGLNQRIGCTCASSTADVPVCST
jgi:hypothetical protein